MCIYIYICNPSSFGTMIKRQFYKINYTWYFPITNGPQMEKPLYSMLNPTYG